MMNKTPKVLYLVVYKHWFDLMLKGIKKNEYRKKSKWILSRVENKEYDLIKFSNGYGKDKKYFFCKYEGYNISNSSEIITFDEHVINLQPGDVIIKLGKIIEKGNF